MDLIYADIINGQIYDRGVLNNFSFDMSFGEKENDFQLKTPLEGTRLEQDQLIYISGTEYGGVIDSIEVDTSNLIIIYSGRTWHGILENKILYPVKGHDYMYLQGDANRVLEELLERMNIIPGDYNELYIKPEHPLMSVVEEDSGIDINMRVTSESGNYAHGYTFIRDMLYANGAKLKIVDGVLSAVPLTDYSNDDDFIVDTDQFTAKRNYNSLNRLHCLGQGNLAKRHTIDLYLDDNGGLLPYCRENPIQDSDYYTDMDALATSTNPEDVANFELISKYMVTGMNEIADIYDYPSIQTTYHYVPLASRPADWGKDLTPSAPLEDKVWGFQNYFQTNIDSSSDEAEYVNVPKPDIVDDFRLLKSAPADWNANFGNYYEKKSNGYTNVESVEQYDPYTGSMPPDWYSEGYAKYFRLEGGNYTQVQLIPGPVLTTEQPPKWSTECTSYAYANGTKVSFIKQEPEYKKLDKQPPKWKDEYNTYYQTDGVNYTSVSGVTKTAKHDVLTTQKPTDWATSYKNYWFNNGKWVHPTSKKAPTWKPNKFYMDRNYTVAPKFAKDLYYAKLEKPDVAPQWLPDTFYADGEVVPTWGSFTVYTKRTIPTWTYNKYYEAYQYQPIPIFALQSYFKQYEDHYEALIEAAKNKIAEYMSKDDLEITLDETRVYDINDRVGASDEVTGIGAVERIVQKVVKIQRGIVSFDYNTGK